MEQFANQLVQGIQTGDYVQASKAARDISDLNGNIISLEIVIEAIQKFSDRDLEPFLDLLPRILDSGLERYLLEGLASGNDQLVNFCLDLVGKSGGHFSLSQDLKLAILSNLESNPKAASAIAAHFDDTFLDQDFEMLSGASFAHLFSFEYVVLRFPTVRAAFYAALQGAKRDPLGMAAAVEALCSFSGEPCLYDEFFDPVLGVLESGSADLIAASLLRFIHAFISHQGSFEISWFARLQAIVRSRLQSQGPERADALFLAGCILPEDPQVAQDLFGNIRPQNTNSQLKEASLHGLLQMNKSMIPLDSDTFKHGFHHTDLWHLYFDLYESIALKGDFIPPSEILDSLLSEDEPKIERLARKRSLLFRLAPRLSEGDQSRIAAFLSRPIVPTMAAVASDAL